VDDDKDAGGLASGVRKTAALASEGLGLDFKTVKIIVLTTLAVCALLSVPLFFIMKNFVTFDTLDKYLKLTDSVRPKILHSISEQLSFGYSKNFIFDSTQSIDNTMVFYAAEKQQVTLTINGTSLFGGPQPVMLQINNCVLRASSSEPLLLIDFDLTPKLQACPPEQNNFHTLRIIFPNSLPKGSAYQVKSLVLVYERVHDHIEDK
jgi:hypothetical protein